MEQTARFCGMNWLPPFVVHGAHIVEAAALAASCRQLRERLVPYAAGAGVKAAGPAP